MFELTILGVCNRCLKKMAADAGITKMSVSIRAVTQHRCMPMWLWKQRLKPLAEFQIIFLTCTIRVEKCEIFSTRISSSLYFICSFTWIIFPITTFWAYSILIEGDTAKRTAVDVILCGKLGRSGIHTACESDLAMFSLSFNKSYTILIIPSTVMVSLVTTRRASG